MSADTTQVDADAKLRGEIAAVLAAATDPNQATASLMAVFARNYDQPVWAATSIRDLASSVGENLRLAGVPVSRGQIITALAEAGIAPGEIR